MKRILSLLIVAALFFSLFAVPSLASDGAVKEVYVSELSFMNEDGDTITSPVGSQKVCAVIRAKAFKTASVDYAFTVMAYFNGKLVAAETAFGSLGAGYSYVKSPEISIDAEMAEKLEVKALLTTPDFSSLLASEGNMGAETAEITDIFLGDYRLDISEGVYEYNVLRYLTESEALYDIRVYTADLSSVVEVYEEKEKHNTKYTISAQSACGGESVEYIVNETVYIVDETSLVAIEADGEMLVGFDPAVKEYTMDIKDGASIPELEAYAFSKAAAVNIKSPADASGAFEITVTNGEKTALYTVKLRTVYERLLTDNARYTHADHYVSARTQDSIVARTTHVPLQAKSGANDWVGYAQFEASELEDVEFTGTAVFSGKAGHNAEYNFFVSTHENANTNDKFEEINDNLAKPIGSAELARSQIQDFEFEASKLRVTSQGYIVICMTVSYNPSYTNYVSFTGISLKVKYVTEPAEQLLKKSGKAFDSSVLEKENEEIPPVVSAPLLSVEKSWENSGEKTELKITVSAENLVPGRKAVLKILRPEKQEEDEATTFEKYAWLAEMVPDEAGKANAEFVFADASGEYTFVVDSEVFESSAEERIYIPSAEVVNALIGGLSKNTFEGSNLKEFLDENLRDLAIENSLYSGLVPAGREKICRYITENIEEFTIDGFNSTLSDATGIKGITAKETTENIEKCLEEKVVFNVISRNENYNDYVSLADKASLLTAIREKEYNTPEEIEEALFSFLMVEKIKAVSSYSEITEILSSYRAYVSCYDEYENLTTGNNIKVNKYITSRLNSITTPENINSVIRKGIESAEMPAPQPSRPSGGGGGGGGGGGKPSGALSLGEVITPNPVIEEVKLPFSDVPEDFWGYEAVKTLYYKNIISGKSSSLFCPGDKITRAEFAKLITESADIKDANGALSFTDVSEKDWFFPYISAAVSNGIILGKSEEVFAPYEFITRQDAAVMISRIFKGEQKSTNQKFSDDSEIADYARDAVYILRNKNIINGSNGRFNPANNLTRAEAAQIIKNLLNNIN